MNKIIYYSIIILLIFFFNCNINETTGLITVYNNTDRIFKSVAVGETNISMLLSSNNKTDNWFYQKLKGKITIIRNDNNHSFSTDKSYVFDLNCYYEMRITVKDECYSIDVD